MRAFNRLTAFAASAIIVFAAPSRSEAQNAPTNPLPRDSAKVAVIRQLLRATHAVDLAVTAMETSLPAQRAANPRIPAIFWDRFMTSVHDHAQDLEEVLVGIYDRHFTTEEVRQLLGFYQTPVGRKLLEAQPTIFRESMLAGQEWGQRIGFQVAQQLEKEGVKIQP